ncbi:MAG: GIY-YIG nuclease family protein [Vicinamibacterales bacterium]
MGLRTFDRKFGAAFLETMPAGPGVYLFRDAAQRVLYVGKARNLRRRLQGYRNATRRKVHRKMRALVREAESLEVRVQASERDALLQENALIRELRPPYNVDGAFAFLYPAIGLGEADGHTLLAFTTAPEAWEALGLHWFGVFRSRPRAKDAFDALVELLALIGHPSPRSRLPRHASRRGARLVGLRRVPGALVARLAPFLGGEDRSLLAALSMALLGKPRALRDASLVEARLRELDEFFDVDARRLREALARAGRRGTFVPGDERDALFIVAKFESD